MIVFFGLWVFLVFIVLLFEAIDDIKFIFSKERKNYIVKRTPYGKFYQRIGERDKE